jgi:hypothetical protein
MYVDVCGMGGCIRAPEMEPLSKNNGKTCILLYSHTQG